MILISACVYMGVYTNKHTDPQTHTHIYIFICLYVCICIPTHIYPCTYTHTHTYIYMYKIFREDELGMIQFEIIKEDSYKLPQVLNV